ncbi:hypothetical protein CBER1_01356 [Cercospora berteroae]|uniref:PWWP domain-containing protein n=1 Tax=Cercospora berteroae TaxID=357750 RepID=A0A2S6CCG9_9PEZI|nr:hypothetical protein CBER1_01356 [Cercospora berteroae]
MASSKPPIPPGTNCIASIKGIPWPVVICSDEVAPAQFLAIRREPAHIPVIQLGRYRYIFVHRGLLKPAEPHIDYLDGLKAFPDPEVQPDDGPEIIEEKQRRRAFRTDLQLFKGDHFWANFITNQSEARKIEKQQLAKYSNLQRTYTKPRNRQNMEFAHSRSAKRQKLQSNNHAHWQHDTKQKQRNRDRVPRHDSFTSMIEPSDDDGSDCEDLSDNDDEYVASGALSFPVLPSAPTSKRKPATDDFDGKVHQSIEGPSRCLSRSCETTFMANAPELPKAGPLDCVVIFPYGELSSIAVGKNVVSNCPYLAARTCDDESTSQLDLRNDKRAIETNLAASDLAAVLEFYATGEIGPRLVNQPSDDPEISAVDQLETKKDKHAETLGKAFATAVKIEDELLQDLIHQKLCALYPLTPLGILIVAKCVSKLSPSTWSIQHDVSTWVTQHLIQSYWAIAKNYVGMLQRLLEENETLRHAVYDGLKGIAQPSSNGHHG